MTDSSQLMPNNTAITSDLNYSLKPSATRSRSYRASILPTNKMTFNPGDTCVIYVPGGRRNTYLDPGQTYIRMTIKADLSACYVDGHGASVINRIDVFHGSNLLETIQGYNVLSNYILDCQASQGERKGLANLYGFDTGGDRQGALIPGNGGLLTVCLPIFSGTVGVLSDKMLPIGMLSDDIRLEITFETLAQGVVVTTGTSTSWTIVDFQLQLCIVELSDEGESMVRSVANPDEPIFLHGSSWRQFSAIIASGTTGSYSTLVPARFASLKQLACLPRRSTDAVSTAYSISSRVNPNIEYYFWRVGSTIVPNKNVVLINSNNTGGFTEAYAELLKAWHSLHTTQSSTAIGQAYNVAQTAIASASITAPNDTANSYKNGFVIAQELESFAQRSDVLLSGMNTLSSQIFFECNIGTALTTGYNLSFFANYDHILVLERGILSVKF